MPRAVRRRAKRGAAKARRAAGESHPLRYVDTPVNEGLCSWAFAHGSVDSCGFLADSYWRFPGHAYDDIKARWGSINHMVVPPRAKENTMWPKR